MKGYKFWQVVLATIFSMAVFGILAVALFIYSGIYNITATKEDPAAIYHLVHIAMHRSVKVRADEIHVPDLNDKARIDRGFVLFRANCVQCHGAPGVAPEPFTYGMRPLAPPLNVPAREVPPEQIFWVVKNGIKMTAMPAWERRMDEGAMWDVTAFVKHLPEYSPTDYRRRETELAKTAVEEKPSAPVAVRAGDAGAGRRVVEAYLCVTCHKVPGIAGGNNTVGPDLAGIASREYIGGTLPNTPENMLRWLRDPQAVKPGSAMPKLGMDEQELRDMTAFLYTLDKP